MLTQKDVAMMVLEEIREGGYYNLNGEEAAAELNRICGMVDMAQKIMQRLEEDSDGVKVLYGDA